ncbi:hypothetical protein K8I28_14545 [bacterium]|nr:hypothetical protein [bacterium]
MSWVNRVLEKIDCCVNCTANGFSHFECIGKWVEPYIRHIDNYMVRLNHYIMNSGRLRKVTNRVILKVEKFARGL